MFSGEETKTDQNTEPLKEKKEEEEEKDNYLTTLTLSFERLLIV